MNPSFHMPGILTPNTQQITNTCGSCKGQEQEIGLFVTLHKWDQGCHPHSKAAEIREQR